MNASGDRGKPFDASGKQSADIAYMSYLFIAATLAIAGLLALVYQSPLSGQRFAEYQALGMIVVLPLAMLALLAALVGLFMSLSVLAYRPVEWGLAVLPVCLVALFVAFAHAEDESSPYPVVLALAFVVCALWFGVGWFTKRRGRTMGRE